MLILASGSAIRARILEAAGLQFTVCRPDVDEAALKRDCAREGLGLEETAMRLAEAKALSVASREGMERAIVLGSDQILEFEGRGFDKPASMAEAKARLLAMAGAPHTLINAVAICEAGAVAFRRLDRPRLFMRSLTEAEVDRYLAAAGPDILHSVGAYQVESLGSRLFERIEGDYFAVLGLSLFPVLSHLRRAGAAAF